MKGWLKAVCSLFLLGLALYLLDWEGLKLALRKIDGWAFAQAIAINVLIFVVLAFRWYSIIRPVVPLRLAAHLEYYFYATFLNSFTPANIGGDVYRWASLKQFSTNSVQIVVALAKERLLGLLIYLIAYLVCLPGLLNRFGQSDPYQGNVFIYAGAAILLAVIGFLVAPHAVLPSLMQSEKVKARPWLFATLRHVRDAMRFDSWRNFLWLMACSAVSVILWIVAVQVVASGLGMRIPLSVLGAIVVLTELVRFVPVTIQGIGLREGTFAYLFASLGESAEAGFVLGAVSYIALSCAIVFCGFLGWALLQIDERRTKVGA